MIERLLFLDIDGVLNPFQAKSNLHGDWRKVRFGDGGRYWVSLELGQWLRDLSADGVRVVWATTWINDPNDLERYSKLIGVALDLDRIRFEPEDRLTGMSESGKQRGIETWLDEHSPDPVRRRAVWVDDDIGPMDRDFGVRHGMVTFAPHPASGLADRSLRRAICEALG